MTRPMSHDAVIARLQQDFSRMPPKVQAAARFLIERPKEVALLSMREQARLAGSHPATMTRLAQALGYAGFDELKSVFADAIRHSHPSFSSRTARLKARRKAIGDAGLISDYVDVVAAHLALLKSESVSSAIVRAAACLRRAKSLYALGARSVFPVAYQFAYVQSYFSDQVVLLDAPGATGVDRIQRAKPSSALLVVSVKPYAALSVAVTRLAHERGLKIVAVTDSLASPVARLADVGICVETASPSFFDTIAPAFVLSEILVALLAAHADAGATKRIREYESDLVSLGAFWTDASGATHEKKTRKRPSPGPPRAGAQDAPKV